MPQPFPPESNAIAKLSLWFVLASLLFGLSFAMGFVRSDYITGKNEQIEQPLPFSHKHHVKGLGLDCRYCHTGVERAAYAGIPDTQTCLGCHQEIWKGAKVLAPLDAAVAKKEGLPWLKIYRLPGYVYFDHSIHVAKGVGCISCHGKVSEMPRIIQARSFLMKDCLECHAHPENFVRPLNEVFTEHELPPADHAARLELMKRNHVQVQNLSDCSRCHR